MTVQKGRYWGDHLRVVPTRTLEGGLYRYHLTAVTKGWVIPFDPWANMQRMDGFFVSFRVFRGQPAGFSG